MKPYHIVKFGWLASREETTEWPSAIRSRGQEVPWPILDGQLWHCWPHQKQSAKRISPDQMKLYTLEAWESAAIVARYQFQCGGRRANETNHCFRDRCPRIYDQWIIQGTGIDYSSHGRSADGKVLYVPGRDRDKLHKYREVTIFPFR
jgi:hypothetical protein